MIRFIQEFINEIRLLSPFRVVFRPLGFTRITEKFDVVNRVPVYIRITR